MWVKVIKQFGSALVGETFELKGSNHHNALIERGYIEEIEAPAIEGVKPVNGAYSTSSIVDESVVNDKQPAKPGPKKKEDKK